METTLPTYIAGPLFLIIIFILCVVFAVGLKLIVLRFSSDKREKKIPVTVQPKKHRKRKRKPAPAPTTPPVIKSVEIDPAQVDKIFFKKTS